MTDLLKCHVSPTGNIITPRGRMYFCAVAEKFLSKADKAKGKTVEADGAFVVTLVVPPNADLTALVEKMKAKAKEKWPSLPQNLKYAIRKCSEVFDAEGQPKYPEDMKDHFQITANTYKQRPNVINSKNEPLNKAGPDESNDDVTARLKEECYSGRWARISVQPAVYDRDGNRGVKLYLQNVQVLDHDEVLGGKNAKAEDDFAPVEAPAATGGAASTDALFT